MKMRSSPPPCLSIPRAPYRSRSICLEGRLEFTRAASRGSQAAVVFIYRCEAATVLVVCTCDFVLRPGAFAPWVLT